MPSPTHCATLFGLLVRHRTTRSAFASLQKLGRYVVYTHETCRRQLAPHIQCAWRLLAVSPHSTIPRLSRVKHEREGKYSRGVDGCSKPLRQMLPHHLDTTMYDFGVPSAKVPSIVHMLLQNLLCCVRVVFSIVFTVNRVWLWRSQWPPQLTIFWSAIKSVTRMMCLCTAPFRGEFFFVRTFITHRVVLSADHAK